MRKPRDYDSELKAIGERAKQLQDRKLRQLGELVAATGADALPIEVLAGALIAARNVDPAAKEEWHARGTAFFQRSRKASGEAPSQSTAERSPGTSGAAAADAERGTS